MNRKIIHSFSLMILIGFYFPVMAQINRIDNLYKSKNLSGIILNPNDEPLVGCTVEKLTENWKEQIKSVTTDLNGKVKFSSSPSVIYYLRISCREFQTYEIKVLTNQRSKKLLRLNLELAI